MRAREPPSGVLRRRSRCPARIGAGDRRQEAGPANDRQRRGSPSWSRRKAMRRSRISCSPIRPDSGGSSTHRDSRSRRGSGSPTKSFGGKPRAPLDLEGGVVQSPLRRATSRSVRRMKSSRFRVATIPASRVAPGRSVPRSTNGPQVSSKGARHPTRTNRPEFTCDAFGWQPPNASALRCRAAPRPDPARARWLRWLHRDRASKPSTSPSPDGACYSHRP